MIKGSIRRGENFLGYHCYGVEYTMVVTGRLFCNKTPYNDSKIFIKECEEAHIVCKNVSDVPLIGNTFNHSAKLSNERKVHFSLIIEIYHKCCNTPFETIDYEKQFPINLQNYNFQCGSLKNFKDYGKIDLPVGGTLVPLSCGRKSLSGTKVDIMLCNTYGAFCVTVETITLSNNELTYSKTITNKRKSDSILRIDVNHNCCGLIRNFGFFPNTKTLYAFENYLKCGNDANTKHFDNNKIDLSECSSRIHIGPFGKK
uniref:ZP domain-containing protein n=1 Tax=Parastrongyloides trichosuri TaxID=131310 RepID=A0A0N4ZD48_PARTI